MRLLAAVGILVTRFFLYLMLHTITVNGFKTYGFKDDSKENLGLLVEKFIVGIERLVDGPATSMNLLKACNGGELFVDEGL